MNNVSKTLYIPLCGKALVSRLGILLHDPKAEEIWAAEGFPLKGKAASKWLAYYMGMRSAVFDRWLKDQLEAMPDAIVLHLGCGLDSRCLRVNVPSAWYDVDFPEVIAQRKRHYPGTDGYRMCCGDVRKPDWLDSLPKGNAIVVMEGVSMYLRPEERQALADNLCRHFDRVRLLMDCYTEFAAKASRYKNPIREVGVSQVYGLDDPREMETGDFVFSQEHEMTPEDLISLLPEKERSWFRLVYAGKMSWRLYRLYEYRKKE